MKKYISIILACLFVQLAWAQSGEGYDPQNPGDPQVYYRLTVEASPKKGGSVSPSSMQQLSAGATTYCNASSNAGYKFKQWMVGDKVVSKESNFTYTMPEENVTLIAYFDWVGNEGYNPENPGDPFADGYQHKVTLYATPSVGGYFNSSSFYLREGESTNVYAYSRDGYRFVSWKQNGTIVSTSNPMQITMGTNNQEYTAQFVYDPENPGNPSPNSFNSATGELVIDEFTTGDLNRAISSAIGGSENYHLVQSIKIIGRMSSSDFGFSYRLSNCSLIDLARTTGYTEIPRWSFEDLSALTKIVLPSSVERICYNAFYNCSSLSEIVCYATVPPVLESGAFNNVPSGLIVRVPSSSLSLYTKAEGWKNLTIMPLDEESCAINVSLPSDAGDGRYKNMTLELDNISSGQILKYLITERTSYTFANLVRDTKYNILVKNASGSILGSIQDVEVADKDVNVSFTKLLQPRNVVLNVLANHETVTDQVTVSWTDIDGKYLGQGNILSGILEGSKIVYQISLPQSLGSEYIVPTNTEYTVTNTTNNVICTLQPFDKVQATGCVKDLTTNSAIQNATITLSQRLNDKYSKSQTLKTDSEGKFVAAVFNAPLTATIAANNYISQTVEIEDISKLNELNEVLLKGITGAVITTNFTYQESVAEGVEPEVVEDYSDYANVAYTIFNTTTGKEIKSFKVQYPSIVLLEEVSEGDWLKIVASSKNNSFVDVVAEGLVDSYNRIIVTIPIVQLGGLSVNASTTNNKSNIGILYSNNGQLVRKTNYDGTALNMSGILDGEYTLVSMGNSKFYNSVLNISELSNSGLTEGKDYVKNYVTVKSGRIASIEITDIPEFDESKFYYTGSNTLVSVNKSSVTIGNYITLRGKVDFKSEYADAISDVKLVFDLPENCSFVDNSVLAGNRTCSYSVESGRITVDLPTINDQVRFCVVPRVGGTYRPNAFVRFNLGGETILQPIGSVYFSAENMKITVPTKTAYSSVVVKGVATSDSEVKVYDNGVLVGQTYSIANGQWSTKVDLYKPYSKSYHSLYAEIKNANGEVFLTDTKSLEYDKNYSVLAKVTMLYNGNTIVFDQLEGKNSTNTYSYNPSVHDFTFIADFTKNDTALIKDLAFIVKASDGSKRRIPAIYNTNKNVWVANAKYSNSNKLPVNATVNYKTAIASGIYDEDCVKNDSLSNVKLYEEISNIFCDSLCQFLSVDETSTSFIYDIDGNKMHYSVQLFNFSDKYTLLNGKELVRVKYNNSEYCCLDTIVNNSYMVYLWDEVDNSGILISLENNENPSYIRNILRAPSIGGTIMDWIFNVLGINDIINRYDLGQEDLIRWWNVFRATSNIHFDLNNETKKMLNATCEDGERRLSNSAYEWYDMYNGFYYDDAKLMRQHFSERLERYEKLIDHERIMSSVMNGVGAAVSLALAVVTGGSSAEIEVLATPIAKGFFGAVGGWIRNHLPLIAREMVQGAAENAAINAICNIRSQQESYSQQLHEWYSTEETKIVANYIDLQDLIEQGYKKCKDDEDDDDEDDEEPEDDEDEPEFNNDDLKPSVDPSGYVFEGVSSNRLEGVTATAYYKEQVEDMYGDLHDNIVKWDAEEYAQGNPLFTDENGMYAWDVPQGMWQVKFEKEGYETTYSEWLPVPPPQLDVNVAMTQVRQPEVKAVHAYKNGVEIEFDKYMLPETLTPDNIYVTANGVNVEGEVAMLNEEVSYEGEGTKYASKVRFNPTNTFVASELTLTIANKVKSYAGIQMAENFTQSFDIEKEVKSIMADSLVKVPYQGSKVITLYVQPADAAVGKTMHAESSSEMLASIVQKDVVIDDNGMAQFEIKGELPGTTGITFSIDGVKTTATVIANVGDFEVSAINEPKASLVSGSSVYRGTTVKLTADSKDLKIWYTIDGTCPCDENGSRKQYTESIVINSDMTLKAIAENADGDASDVATFIYSILQSKTGVALNNGWNWVSFNMKNDALCSVNTALASSSWTSDDVIKDNKYVDMYSTIQKQWIGTLSKHGALNNTQMYKVRSSKSQTLGLTGEAVHPSETTITVVSGWNYISYLPMVNMNVSDALKGYKAENGDVIKSQDAFATYSSANGWEGDLTTMTVGRGYMLKRGVNASQVSFTYPVESFGSSVKAAAPAKSYRYADNMNIIGEVEGINVEDGDSLVAYVNGEIRGASRLERNHKVFLTIQGDEDAKVAMVLVRDGEIIATASNMIRYQSNNVLGTSDAPTAITFVTDDSRLDGNVGNVKAIYGINGIKMNTRHLNNIPSGTYIIYSEKNGNTCVTKFIK